MTDLVATGELLAQAFPGARVADPAYLRWLYVDNPHGPVIETNLDDEQGRAGHYAIVPTLLHDAGALVPAALSLNTAVHERARGGGVFTRLAQQAYEQAAALGRQAVIGVANANSTPGFTRRLEFELVGQLPVRVLLPRFGRRVPIGDGLPDPQTLDALLSESRTGATVAWSGQTLRWRLDCPGAEYAVHYGDDWLAITTLDSSHALPVAVVLAVFAARAMSSSEQAALVRHACRRHRAPIALHVGHNDRFTPRALPLPERWRPSPLNFIFRRLGNDGRGAPVFTRFEFLDFDAY